MLLSLNGHTEKELGFALTKKVCCSWATKKNGIADIDYYNRTKDKHTLSATDGLPIYNITNFTLGFTTASKIANKEACKSYIKKYISKCLGMSTTKFKRRFWYSQNLAVPEIVKTEIGSGFDFAKDLQHTNDIDLINALRQAKATDDSVFECYNKDYNVLQYWFGSDKYSEFEYNRKRGLIPTNELTPFDKKIGEKF